MRHFGITCSFALLCLCWAGEGRAAPDAPGSLSSPCRFCYVHGLARSAIGGGLRFNNPYRLQTPLGGAQDGVSATAAYFDQLLGALLGDPNGWQYGVALGWSATLGGVPQDVLTPSLFGYYRWSPNWSMHARAGLPIILRPDGNVGGELALGAEWMVRGGLGLFVDAIGDLFVGAATLDRTATAIPVLGIQAGLSIEYEVLP